MKSEHLFDEINLGEMTLRNRVVMAPMTRNRAASGGVPTDLNALYYSQRASAGLIIAESTQVSETGVSYARTPGLHTTEQVEGWRNVTTAVHAAEGRIFAQICHGGRISHPDLQPDGAWPVAPSAKRPPGLLHTGTRQRRMPIPRALSLREIQGIIDEFAWAARNAREGGFDGIELHAANGYLIDQFLRDGVNERGDAYGGSTANRARLLLEILEAVQGSWPSEAVSVRISPRVSYNGMSDSDPFRTFTELAARLQAGKLGVLHVIEPIVAGHYMEAKKGDPIAPAIRSAFQGRLILNGGYTRTSAAAAIENGDADLISFGEPFIANPDLVERLRSNLPLASPEREGFYQPDAQGYTTYPALGDLVQDDSRDYQAIAAPS